MARHMPRMRYAGDYAAQPDDGAETSQQQQQQQQPRKRAAQPQQQNQRQQQQNSASSTEVHDDVGCDLCGQCPIRGAATLNILRGPRIIVPGACSVSMLRVWCLYAAIVPSGLPS